jgi:hypothetical protein
MIIQEKNKHGVLCKIDAYFLVRTAGKNYRGEWVYQLERDGENYRGEEWFPEDSLSDLLDE